MNTIDLLKALSDSVFIGHHRNTLEIAERLLGDFSTKVELCGGNTAFTLKGEGDRTLLLEAHIDEIGFTVTEITDEGFLKVAAVGGIDLRTLPSHRVLIHGKQPVSGVFTSIPPHLSKDEAIFDDIDKLYIDTSLGKRAKELISVGNFVTFAQSCRELLDFKVTGKALDNRAGVAALLLTALRIRDMALPCNVTFLFCNQEELGTRGAVTSAFELCADEAVCVDVSFGNQPGVAPHECGTLGSGPMIGYSPALSHDMYDTLCSIAKKAEIPYQSEIMSGKTSTDADMVSISRGGVATGLVSIPLRNMHTDCEIVSATDVVATAQLLTEFVLGGGLNA